MDLLAISGSIRSGSSCTALLKAAQQLGAPRGLRVTLFEGLADLPPFDPGLDPEEAPEEVQAFRAQVQAAEGILICTPEYAHGMPGVLKNALEWTVASGEFVGKPVAALSTSPSHSGGAMALAWLTQTLEVMSAQLLPEASEAIPWGRSRVSPEGNLLDPALGGTLSAVLDHLAKAVESQTQAGAADDLLPWLTGQAPGSNAAS